MSYLGCPSRRQGRKKRMEMVVLVLAVVRETTLGTGAVSERATVINFAIEVQLSITR